MVKQMSLLKGQHVQAGEIPAMNRWPGLACSTCTVLTWASEQLHNWSKPCLRTSAICNSPPALSCYCQTYLIASLHREGRQQQHRQACSKCIQLGSPRSSNHFHGNGTVDSSHSLSLLWLNWCTHVTMDNSGWFKQPTSHASVGLAHTYVYMLVCLDQPLTIYYFQ